MIAPQFESNECAATVPTSSETSTGLANRVASGDETGAPWDGSGPRVPVTVSSRRVFQGRDCALFAIVTLLNFWAMAVCAGLWLSPEGWRQAPAVYIGMMLLLTSAVARQQGLWWLLPIMKTPVPMKVGRNWKVAVATTFVPGSEPLEMLEATVKALIDMDYPHDTWVLDEGDDEAVRHLCAKLGARHFTRKNRPAYQGTDGPFRARTKYGNYNAWLAETGFENYALVTAFDPDHRPAPQFLRSVLGYFEDPQVGYVQVAQAYGNQDESWVARGAAEESYDFYSTIQMAGYGLRMPMIIGCHNSHRVAALRQIGGFGAHDADDILATRLYRDCGWQGVYVPQILARGRTPVDCRSFLAQQRRWARSILDLKLRTYPAFSARTPRAARLFSLLHGFNYLAQGLLPVLALILFSVVCATAASARAVTERFWVPLLVLLAAFAISRFFRQQFYLDPPNERGLHWRAAVLRWARWPQMLGALLDVFLDRHPAYEITPKQGGRPGRFSVLWPHLLGAMVVGGCWLFGVLRGEATALSHGIAIGVVGGTLLLCLANRSAPSKTDHSTSSLTI